MRLFVGATSGFVAGFVLGMLIAGVIWLWAFAQGLSNGSHFSIPGLVRVYEEGDSVYSEVGPLALLLPLALGIVGGALVAGVTWMKANRLKKLSQ